SLEDQGIWWVTDIFAHRAARPAATDLVELIRTWEADLVVRDYWEFGGWAAAEAVGVPTAVVGLAMHTPASDLREFIGPQLQALREHVGLAPERSLESLYRGPYIDLLPASYQLE